MHCIKVMILGGLLAYGYSGQGQDVIKNEKPVVPAVVDGKAVLEKFVQAYSALDDKALTVLTDKPETIAATLKEIQEFKKSGTTPVLTIIQQAR